MDDDQERLSRVLDDLAAERDPHDRGELSAAEAELAETAALLKAARSPEIAPDEGFVDRLGTQLVGAHGAAAPSGPASAHRAKEQSGRASPAASGFSRRGLLGRIVAASAGLAVGAGAGAAAAAAAAYDRGKHDGYHQAAGEPFTTPMVPADRGNWLDTGITVAGLRAGQATRFRAGAVEGFLVNPGNGAPIYAVSASCTHMGCLISWLDSTGTFLCPCHGAQYNANGTVLSGIARHPLPRLRVRVTHHGRLYIWSVTTHPAVTTLAPYAE